MLAGRIFGSGMSREPYKATNLMLKINTQNTVNRAYTWLKLFSVVIDNICAVRILYRELSDLPFSGEI